MSDAPDRRVKMTREEFEAMLAEQDKAQPALTSGRYQIVPCDCGDGHCRGWRRVWEPDAE